MIRIKIGKYELDHDRYIDDFGIERDSFEILWYDEKGFKYHKPFLGDIKVNTMTRDSDIRKIHYKYTKEDYKKILLEQISKIELSTD